MHRDRVVHVFIKGHYVLYGARGVIASKFVCQKIATFNAQNCYCLYMMVVIWRTSYIHAHTYVNRVWYILIYYINTFRVFKL